MAAARICNPVRRAARGKRGIPFGAFLSAGAPRVLGSLWKVDDDATSATLLAVDPWSGNASVIARGTPGFTGADLANTINEVLRPRGVAVVIEAAHQCMTTRGVNKTGVDISEEIS